METLNNSSWDVVVSGTGVPQSLLALALSRSGKKILHVDCNRYYGGDEAALGLADAEDWAQRHAAQPADNSTSFSHAVVNTPKDNATTGPGQLSHSRAYCLALAPQLLYTRCALLPALVSSQTHSQLEFQAVGSWFILATPADATSPQLTRVPGGREDIFQDSTLDLKAKRALMKFLRFITNYEEQQDTWHGDRSRPFSQFLQDKFGLPPASHPPILALTMSIRASESTLVEFAVPRIANHLTSIGLFGPGFGSVLPKWGGLAEIGQVACRASAVGGGVYVLGRGVDDVQNDDEFSLSVDIGEGEKVTTKWLVGVQSALPGPPPSGMSSSPTSVVSKKISIISSPLTSLFPPTSEGGVTPAGAVVLVPSGNATEPPVHLFAHSSEAGECPSSQCIIYASVALDHRSGYARLESAISGLLQSVEGEHTPRVLWTMQYQQLYPPVVATPQRTGPVITLQSLTSELIFEDAVLDDVKSAWQQITHGDPADFMKFEAREGTREYDQ